MRISDWSSDVCSSDLTIALRAPMADDLREMIAALKIVSVVERIGDYAKNIAKRVALMDQTRSIEAIPLLTSMSSIVAELIHDALDSFAARDAELAVRVTVRDTNVDDFYNSLFRQIGSASCRARVCQYG